MKTIKILKAIPGHKVGDQLTVNDDEAKAYVSAGIAEEIPAEVPDLDATLAKMAATAIAEYEAKIAKSGGRGPRIDPLEQQEDRTKGFGDQVKLITKAMCPNLFPGEQAKARELLENKYNSEFAQFDKKDLAEGSGTTGGYTVKPDYGTELLKVAAEMSIVRPYANVKKLPAREAYYPMLNQTFVPSGTADSPQTAFVGGVQMTWGGEAQVGTPTEPNFKQVHVLTKVLQGLTKISTFLISDSFLSIDAELKSLFAEAISWTEDFSFLAGDGKGKPLGLTNSPALITVTRSAANAFALADAANMMGKMIPQSRPKAVWVMTNALFSLLVQLADGSGRVVYIPNVGTGYDREKLAAGQTGLLLFGRPVIFTEKLPATGSTGDVLLADFSKYIVADTGGLQIAASDQYAFNTNQITYRVIQRVDGQPQIDAPFTQQDGASKISPFVTLHS